MGRPGAAVFSRRKANRIDRGAPTWDLGTLRKRIVGAWATQQLNLLYETTARWQTFGKLLVGDAYLRAETRERWRWVDEVRLELGLI